MYYKPEAYKFWGGRIPKRVRMIKTVRSDLPWLTNDPVFLAPEGQEFEVKSSQSGAIAAIMANGQLLGLKPDEVEVIEWIDNPFLSCGKE